MKYIIIRRSILVLIILGIFITACQPVITTDNQTPESTQSNQIDVSPTLTPEPTPVSEEEIFFDEHSFIVVDTGNEQFPVVALGEGGEALAPVIEEGKDLNATNVKGAVWINEFNGAESVVVEVGNDRLPKLMKVGDFVVLFSEYTDTTVSLVIFNGEEMVGMSQDVPLDSEMLKRYKNLISEDTAGGSHLASIVAVPHHAESIARMFEVTGLLVSLTYCIAAAAFPPTLWVAIGACGSALLTAVTTFTGEDLDIFGGNVPIIVVDALGCIAQEMVSCATMIIDAIVIFFEVYEEMRDANQEEFDKAVDDLSCSSWFVYAETHWNGCANCATGPDLFETKEQALASCEHACGQACQILREPYCEVYD